MARVKIYELAKELSIESKEIIRKLGKMGIEAKTHMSSISEKDAEMIRNSVAANKKGKDAPGPGGDSFVPRVKRITKAQIAQEQSDKSVDEDVATADAAAPLDVPKEETAKTKDKAATKDEAAPVEQETNPQAKPAKKETKAKEAAETKEDADAQKVKPESATKKKAADKQSSKASIPQEPKEPKEQADKPTEEAKPKTKMDDASTARPKKTAEQQTTDKSRGGKKPVQADSQDKYSKKDNVHKPQEERNKEARSHHDKSRGKKPEQGATAPFDAESKPHTHRKKKVFVKDTNYKRDFNGDNFRGKKGYKGKGYKDNKVKKAPKVVMPPVTPKKITIGETVVLGELAKTMGKTAAEIIKKLFEMGTMATINQELDSETAILLADEFGVTVEVKADRAAEILEDIEDDEGDMRERPAVVTIMGHVDHGKTSLLDAIRHTNVVLGEAGGITQHIGAYQVECKGKKITFLDTPGHEAFTAMRARGANMTDIAIIVVAADDGVMPQTIEAINHSKAAGVPIIIAINKIDKPGADSSRVRQELTEHGLVAEEWGGETIMVEVSAKNKINLDGLLEMILLVAEVGELKANYDRQARGAVIEAKLDKNRGPVATLLVQKGTLRAGENILAGAVFGKVKAMHDDKGHRVKVAGPSMPVEVLGFSEVPPAGEIFISVKDEKDARMVASKFGLKKREEELHKGTSVSLDNLFQHIAEGEIKELNLVVKADVQGSVEALIQSLYKLNTDEVKVNVIHSGVGAVSESDVMLSAASKAIILGFNIIAAPAARAAAAVDEVDIRLYRVIYDALEDIKLAMGGLLAPEYKESIIGHVEIRQVIKVPKVGLVAGSYVTDGKVTRNATVKVIRDGAIIADDKIEGLRRFKDDAKEVMQGFECGISLEKFQDIKEGDELEIYEIEEIARKL